MTTPSEVRRPRLLATLIAASSAGAASSRRDRGMVAGLFLLPLLIITIIGVAMRGYSDPVFTVGFLDQSGSAMSLALREALAAEPVVRVRDYTSADAMRAATYRGRLHAGVLVPEGWQGETDLELYATAAGVGAIVVRSIADARLARTLAPEAAQSVPSRVHDGGTERSPPIGFHYTAPSNLVLFLVISGIVSSTGLLVMRRRGITHRLLATPARTVELILLMLISPAQIMVVQALFLLASTALAFGVPWGDPLGVALLTTSLIAVALSLSLFMTTIFRTPEQAFSLAPLIAIGAGMLGGCMWPLSIVPAWLREAGHVLPTAWAMDGYLDLIFERGTFWDVLPNAGVLLAMAMVFGTIGTIRFRRELGHDGH
jgi:ABC-2 type transport system permease protein